MSKKQEAHLEQWQVHDRGGWLQLTGIVRGHPHLRDGEYIYTSPVVSFNKSIRLAETNNTFYSLGEPAELEPNYN